MPSVAWAGRRQRQQQLPEDGEARCAVEQRRLVDLARDAAKILGHQEDAERRGEAGRDQGKVGVVQGGGAEHLVARDDHRLLGNGEAEQDDDETGSCVPEIRAARSHSRRATTR